MCWLGARPSQVPHHAPRCAGLTRVPPPPPPPQSTPPLAEQAVKPLVGGAGGGIEAIAELAPGVHLVQHSPRAVAAAIAGLNGMYGSGSLLQVQPYGAPAQQPVNRWGLGHGPACCSAGPMGAPHACPHGACTSACSPRSPHAATMAPAA